MGSGPWGVNDERCTFVRGHVSHTHTHCSRMPHACLRAGLLHVLQVFYRVPLPFPLLCFSNSLASFLLYASSLLAASSGPLS